MHGFVKEGISRFWPEPGATNAPRLKMCSFKKEKKKKKHHALVTRKWGEKQKKEDRNEKKKKNAGKKKFIKRLFFKLFSEGGFLQFYEFIN